MSTWQTLIIASSSVVSTFSAAQDIYDSRTNRLSIPWVQAYGNVYSNVTVTVDQILRLNQTFNIGVVDFYDSRYDELYIGTVNADGKTYRNVVIRPGRVLGAGGSGVAPKDCGGPIWDYIATIGDYTLSTNLWGIRGANTWVQWRPEDFEMCIEGRGTQTAGASSITAAFNWRWPLEPYDDPRKPITKNFPNIDYTPRGGPMTPVSLKSTTLVLHHDIEQRGSGNNQTFYDLYAGNTSTPIESGVGTAFTGAINISIRIFSTTGNEGKDETFYRGVVIDGHEWTVRTNGKSWIQFMVANNSLLKGDLRLREFIAFMKTINFQADMDKYFLKSIQLGNEQIDGTGGLTIKTFYVTN